MSIIFNRIVEKSSGWYFFSSAEAWIIGLSLETAVSFIFNRIVEEISSGWASIASFIFDRNVEEISSGRKFFSSPEALTWFFGFSPAASTPVRGWSLMSDWTILSGGLAARRERRLGHYML